MTKQTVITTKPAIAADVPTDAPTGDFAPQTSTHPVATLTLGRQTFNDSDKANYFEG